MKLIIISNPTNVNNEYQLLNTLFDNGLEYFHLRKPNSTEQEMETYIQHIASAHWNKIVLHSHHRLVDKYKLKGKHLSHSNILEKHKHSKSNSADISEIRGKYISTSFHSLQELEENKKKYEYTFLSPVFDSISKDGYKSNFNFQELQNSPLLRRGAGGEVFALGGIDSDKIEIVNELGFDGVAVLGAVWLSNDPIEKFKQLQEICNMHSSSKNKNYA